MSCRQLWKITAHDRWTIEYRCGIRDAFFEFNPGGRQPFSVSGDARTEATSLGERGGRRARSRVASCLVDACQLFRESLGPTTRQGGVIVDKDIGTVVDGRLLEERLN